MENKIKIGVNSDFTRKVRIKLKEKGIVIKKPELIIIIKTVFEVIQNEYFAKYKKISFSGFGTFDTTIKSIKKSSAGLFPQGGKYISYKFNIGKEFKQLNRENFNELSKDE